MNNQRTVIYNSPLRFILIHLFLQLIHTFEDTATVLQYISSGYLYKDPVQPNTNQLTRTQYFQRYTQYGIPEQGKVFEDDLVHAKNIKDFSQYTLTDSDKESSETTLEQQILVRFYNKYTNVYKSYYKFDKLKNSYQTVEFLVDPCKKISDKSLCTEDSSVLVDQPSIQAGKDMLIAFKTDTIILHCSEEWQKLINCGSFIEIHRPLDPYIIEQKKIEEFLTSSIHKFYYFNTRKLCAGRYEIWYVVRTRIGVILQYTKPFFVSYPSCSCSHHVYLRNVGEC